MLSFVVLPESGSGLLSRDPGNCLQELVRGLERSQPMLAQRYPYFWQELPQSWRWVLTPCRYIFVQTQGNPLLTSPKPHAPPTLRIVSGAPDEHRDQKPTSAAYQVTIVGRRKTSTLSISHPRALDFSHPQHNRRIPMGAKAEDHRISPNTLFLPFAPKTALGRSMQDSILLMNPKRRCWFLFRVKLKGLSDVPKAQRTEGFPAATPSALDSQIESLAHG